jgi:hypothetical protein
VYFGEGIAYRGTLVYSLTIEFSFSSLSLSSDFISEW